MHGHCEPVVYLKNVFLLFRYGSYARLCGILSKYIKTTDNLLVIGCGNSDLSTELYDVGYHNIINIDISATVIKQMVLKNSSRINMQFLQMDILQVPCRFIIILFDT